jgi:hypothetical protein
VAGEKSLKVVLAHRCGMPGGQIPGLPFTRSV